MFKNKSKDNIPYIFTSGFTLDDTVPKEIDYYNTILSFAQTHSKLMNENLGTTPLELIKYKN